MDDFLKMKTADKAAERKHGVGLGSEISQIIALDFASPIDHYVKDVRGIHGYGRYMDDGYVISPSLAELADIKQCLYALAEELGIAMSDKKNIITPFRHHSFTFLKMRVTLRESGKVTMKLSRKSIPGAPEAVPMEAESGELIFQNTARIQTVGEASNIAFVVMAEAGSIDDTTAGEHAEVFAPWAVPVNYKAGNIRRHGGKLYRCVQDHTSQEDWTPDAAASLWVCTADPAEEWPAWSQPVGAFDTYGIGAKVSHNDKHWTSDTDNNVWEPGVYGWTEATEEE